jgi:RNA polymerase subunit RPABC4/transcription elongation factor Spt4
MASEPEGCLICGASVDEDALKCPSCGTILPRQVRRCEHCGEVMQAYAATCPYCGRPRTKEEVADEVQRDEVIRRLTLAPGVDERVAAALYREGVRDFADVIALSLPESEREKGLHKILARRLIISELKKKEAPMELIPCGRCGGPVPLGSAECEVCGASLEVPATRKIEEIGDRVGKAIREIYSDLTDDASFRRMPHELQEEMMDALAEVDEEELLRQEYREQIDAWREKGFDVSALEKLLEWDLRLFKEESVKIIKTQIQRRKEKGKEKCPLCLEVLPEGAVTCPNCGARLPGV